MNGKSNSTLSIEQHRLLFQLRQKTGRLGVLLNNGFTTEELRDMIIVGFINADFGTVVNRVQTARKNGTDRPGNPARLNGTRKHY